METGSSGRISKKYRRTFMWVLILSYLFGVVTDYVLVIWKLKSDGTVHTFPSQQHKGDTTVFPGRNTICKGLWSKWRWRGPGHELCSIPENLQPTLPKVHCPPSHLYKSLSVCFFPSHSTQQVRNRFSLPYNGVTEVLKSSFSNSSRLEDPSPLGPFIILTVSLWFPVVTINHSSA